MNVVIFQHRITCAFHQAAAAATAAKTNAKSLKKNTNQKGTRVAFFLLEFCFDDRWYI